MAAFQRWKAAVMSRRWFRRNSCEGSHPVHWERVGVEFDESLRFKLRLVRPGCSGCGAPTHLPCDAQ